MYKMKYDGFHFVITFRLRQRRLRRRSACLQHQDSMFTVGVKCVLRISRTILRG